MAKIKPDWIKAKALFEVGKSLRDIAKESFIDHSRIGKIAKKEGWERLPGIPQLVTDAVSVEMRKATLCPQVLDIVDKAVDKQLEGMAFYSSHARIVTKIALKSLQQDMTPSNAKTTMATLKEGLIVEGLVPFYPSAPQVNTQVNTQDSRKTINDFYQDTQTINDK